MRVFCRDKVKVPEIRASETATPKISGLIGWMRINNLVARFKMKNWWNAPTFLSVNLPFSIFTWKASVPVIIYHYFVGIVGRVNIRETHCDIYTMWMEMSFFAFYLRHRNFHYLLEGAVQRTRSTHSLAKLHRCQRTTWCRSWAGSLCGHAASTAFSTCWRTYPV